MAKPQTIIRDGSGAQSASYSLPPGVFQYVESVLVQVDNTAGPDVRPTLSVATVNGVVMAAKRQGEAIPAGDTGTATWALRLTDEAAAAASGILNPPLQERFFNGGFTSVPSLTDTQLEWVSTGPDSLLDLTNPFQPSLLTAGVYTLAGSVQCASGPQAAGVTATIIIDFISGPEAGTVMLDTTTFAPTFAVGITGSIAGTTSIQARVDHTAAGNLDFLLDVALVKIASL